MQVEVLHWIEDDPLRTGEIDEYAVDMEILIYELFVASNP